MVDTNEQDVMPGEIKSRLGGALYLVLFAIFAAWILSNIHESTRQRIADNELAERLKELQALLPHGEFDNEPHKDFIFVTDPGLLGSNKPQPIYRIRNGGMPVAAVVSAVAPNGFSGKIRLLVSIDLRGQILGVRVTSHSETPGLGDAIEADKSDWIKGFAGLAAIDPLSSTWVLDEDGGSFDKITGATVSSRAVLGAARNAVIYFNAHRAELFAAPPDPIPD
jgi:electron transport complex protein RnfG